MKSYIGVGTVVPESKNCAASIYDFNSKLTYISVYSVAISLADSDGKHCNEM